MFTPLSLYTLLFSAFSLAFPLPGLWSSTTSVIDRSSSSMALGSSRMTGGVPKTRVFVPMKSVRPTSALKSTAGPVSVSASTTTEDGFTLRSKIKPSKQKEALEYLRKNVAILGTAQEEMKRADKVLLDAKLELARNELKVPAASIDDVVMDTDIHTHTISNSNVGDVLLESLKLQKKVKEALPAVKEAARKIQDAKNNIQAIAFHSLTQVDDDPLSRKEARKLVPLLEQQLLLPPHPDWQSPQEITKLQKQALLYEDEWFSGSIMD